MRISRPGAACGPSRTGAPQDAGKPDGKGAPPARSAWFRPGTNWPAKALTQIAAGSPPYRSRRSDRFARHDYVREPVAFGGSIAADSRTCCAAQGWCQPAARARGARLAAPGASLSAWRLFPLESTALPRSPGGRMPRQCKRTPAIRSSPSSADYPAPARLCGSSRSRRLNRRREPDQVAMAQASQVDLLLRQESLSNTLKQPGRDGRLVVDLVPDDRGYQNPVAPF